MSKDERATLEVGDRSVYAEGDLLYQAMLADLQAATCSIRLESYIFASDAVGAAFFVALRAAARRGVSVALRADHAGSFFTLASADIRRLRSQGIDFHWSRRWRLGRPLTFNRRNHRKLLIVDDQVAYLGGFNIHAPCSLRLHGPSRWRDTHLRFCEFPGEIENKCKRQPEQLVWLDRADAAQCGGPSPSALKLRHDGYRETMDRIDRALGGCCGMTASSPCTTDLSRPSRHHLRGKDSRMAACLSVRSSRVSMPKNLV